MENEKRREAMEWNAEELGKETEWTSERTKYGGIRDEV